MQILEGSGQESVFLWGARQTGRFRGPQSQPLFSKGF
jgi:hypothetical protein